MNKVANLAKKHRMIAPKVCDKFSLGSSATKENQSRATITMGELILNNKGTQRQREVFKQNVAKPTCITRTTKRKLALVDEDDDNDEDDETFQDVIGANSEQDGLKYNENEGDIMRYQVTELYASMYVQKRCLRAKEIRMSQKNMHTAGPKSFARIRDEMKNDDPNKESPTLTQMFERTRKMTEGRAYVDTYDDTARKIEQMKNYKPQEDESALVDPFMIVMNKEHHGYRRLYGRGVTNKLIKKVDGSDTSYMIPEGLVESFKASVEVEKNQLLEMRKEIEEDHERKKAELEAMRKDIENQRENLKAMQKDILNQQENLEAKMRKLMEQF